MFIVYCFLLCVFVEMGTVAFFLFIQSTHENPIQSPSRESDVFERKKLHKQTQPLPLSDENEEEEIEETKDFSSQGSVN